VLLFRMMFCFTFLNTTFFIAWLSKKEATIETTVFGVDLLAMKTGVGAFERIVLQVLHDGWMFGWTAKNPVDLAMKTVPSGLDWHYLVNWVVHTL